MLKDTLIFLAANKAVIVGAAATVAELIVISVNLYRRLRAKKRFELESADNPVLASQREPVYKSSLFNDLAWSANPINLFRNP